MDHASAPPARVLAAFSLAFLAVVAPGSPVALAEAVPSGSTALAAGPAPESEPPAGASGEAVALRQQITDLRRELWQLEETLALTPFEVGETVTGAESRRAEIGRVLESLRARVGTVQGAAPDAVMEELLRASGESESLRARIERRTARRNAVGPQLPYSPQREPGDLEIVPTSTHTTCETALEPGSTRVRGIVRPEVWFRVPVPRAMRVTFRSEALAGELALSLHDRCGTEPRLASGAPRRSAFLTTAVVKGDIWVRVKGRSTTDRRHETFSFEVVFASGAISGRVTRADDGSGVQVRVVAVPVDSSSQRVALTTENGEFLISGLAPGSYLLSLRDTGVLVPELWNDHPCAGGPPVGCSLSAANPVVVNDSATTMGVDFQLEVGGRIGGRVLLRPEATPPTSSALVKVMSSAGQLVGSAATDSFGRYQLSGLQGDYRVVASASGRETQIFDHGTCAGTCIPSSGAPVVVGPGVDRSDVDFDLSPLGSIAGKLTSTTGEPIANGYVSAKMMGDPNNSRYTNSDANGRYVVTQLQPGNYVVSASPSYYEAKVWGGDTCTYTADCFTQCNDASATPVTAAVGVTTSGIDFTLRPFPSISGLVTKEEDGAPLPGVIVRNTIPGFCLSTWDESDGAGTYRLESAQPREHRLFSSNALGRIDEVYDGFSCGIDGCSWYSGPYTPVPVTLDGPIDGINFALSRGASIQGVVRDVQGQGAVLCPNGGVELYSGTGMWLRGTCPAADGSYHWDGLPAGTYFVEASGTAFVDERFDGVPCEGGCDGGTPLELALGEQRGGIDLTLDRYGRIFGTVQVQAEPNTLCEGPTAEVDLWDSGGNLLQTVNTDGLGRYDLRVPTSFPVHVTALASHCERSLYPGINCPGQVGVDCLLSPGSRLTAKLNVDLTGVDFTLRPAPGLRGRVLSDPDGAPLPGVVVDLFDATSHAHVWAKQSEADGSFRMDFLWSGRTFHLATDNGAGAVDELWQDIPCPNGPARLGLCDLGLATPIRLREYEIVEGLDFVLSPWPVFKNGFETGSFVGWGGIRSN
ncbi:MAG: carboxypeptidase regulatory-like domain-containing protein [Holophagales bacterium]|nr:MAG: carboxypeptidase regulatory-like domain-containing protein [Holophagales bacterium]